MLWRVYCQSSAWFNTKKQLWNVLNTTKMPFYAVAKGRTAGIFMTWPDCEAQVKGFAGARYKKFNTIEEAQNFITTNTSQVGTKTAPKTLKSNLNSSTVKTSNHNLKRSLNTSSVLHKQKHNSDVEGSKKKSKKKRKSSSDSESDASDDSDDLNTIICKQMDDIEKRLNVFQKGVDKIIKKNTPKITGRKAILIEQSELQPVGFVEDSEGYVQVYTDGACSANGRNGAKAGIGVFWGDNHPLNKSEPVSGRATNNCGEIQAASCAIKIAIQNGIKKLCINTDSMFLINSVTKWMPGWKRKGWKLKSGEPVKNEIDFKELDLLQDQLQIKWNHVDAHRGLHGNEMADQLAKAGAAKYM